MPKKEIDSQKIEDVRIQTVADFILEGLRPKEIKSYCMENFKVCSRTVDNYVKKAKDLIKVAGQKNIEFETAKLMQRFELLFSKCFAYEDYKTCASILKQQSDILKTSGEGEEGGATLSKLEIIYTNETVDSEKSKKELEELRRFKSEHSK